MFNFLNHLRQLALNLDNVYPILTGALSEITLNLLINCETNQNLIKSQWPYQFHRRGEIQPRQWQID